MGELLLLTNNILNLLKKEFILWWDLLSNYVQNLLHYETLLAKNSSNICFSNCWIANRTNSSFHTFYKLVASYFLVLRSTIKLRSKFSFYETLLAKNSTCFNIATAVVRKTNVIFFAIWLGCCFNYRRSMSDVRLMGFFSAACSVSFYVSADRFTMN